MAERRRSLPKIVTEEEVVELGQDYNSPSFLLERSKSDWREQSITPEIATPMSEEQIEAAWQANEQICGPTL